MKRAAFHACGLLLVAIALAWAWLAWNPPAPVLSAMLSTGLAWLVFAAAWCLRSAGGKCAVLIWAIAARLVLVSAPPLFEDDHFRYLWDGHRFYEDGTPYAKAPDAYFESFESVPEPMQAVLDGINYPHVSTIYPPFCQAAFWTAAAISPGALWPWKWIVLAADLLVMLLLAWRFRTRHLLLYAWCPLVLFEIALNAHTDVLGIAAITGACLLLRSRRSLWSGAAVGVAICARSLAVLPAAFLVARKIRPGYCLGALVVVAACYAPFLMRGDGAGMEGMQAMAVSWKFNPLGFTALEALLGDPMARRLAGILFMLVAGLSWCLCRWRKWTVSGSVQVAWAALLLFAPVVNAWYLLWLFPFVVWCPSFTAFAGMAALTCSWMTGMNLADSSLGLHQLHPSALPIQIMMITVGIALDYWTQQRRKSIRMANSSTR